MDISLRRGELLDRRTSQYPGGCFPTANTGSQFLIILDNFRRIPLYLAGRVCDLRLPKAELRNLV